MDAAGDFELGVDIAEVQHLVEELLDVGLEGVAGLIYQPGCRRSSAEPWQGPPHIGPANWDISSKHLATASDLQVDV